MLAQHELDASPVAGEIELWPQLRLTPAQEKQWAEFKACMLWAVPSFSDIWLAMMVDKYCDHAWFTDCIPTAATDDKYLYINPEWWFAMTLDEQLFVACHEVMHAMYAHASLGYSLGKAGEIRYTDGLVLPYYGDLMNKAMDYVINDQLIVAKIGKMPEGGCHWPGVISGEIGVLDSYRICYQYKQGGDGRHPSKRKGRGNDQGPGREGLGGGEGELPGKPFDELLRPGQGRGKSANKAISERSDSEWDTTITAAMESAKLRGQLPSNLDRAFNKRLSPKADWRDLYMLAVSRRIGNDRYTWDVLNQQLAYRRIGAPGRISFGCNLVVIAVDTSGSINQRTLDVFLSETMALLEQARPRQIIFIQCDADIHEWSIAEGTDDLYGKKIKGGGGSRTEPVFERIEEEGIELDMLIYLTDLYVTFPVQAPSYPVIWGAVDRGTNVPPFGELVDIPAQVEA